MLTVRRLQTATEGELTYECVNGEQVVGKLTARSHPDGSWIVKPIEAKQTEAVRTLLAAFEREAVTSRVSTIYLECRDGAEKNLYLPAGYSEMPNGGLVLIKKIPLI